MSKRPVSTVLNVIIAVPTLVSAIYTIYKFAQFDGADLFGGYSLRWITRTLIDFFVNGKICDAGQPYLVIAVMTLATTLIALITVAIFHDCSTEK